MTPEKAETMLRTYSSDTDTLSSSRASVEDTLHVPTMPAPELNSVQTVPQMGPQSVSAVDTHCPALSWVHQGSCEQGSCQGHVSAPPWELLQGVLVMLSMFFFRQINLKANISYQPQCS